MENFLKIFKTKEEYRGTTETATSNHIVDECKLYTKLKITAKINISFPSSTPVRILGNPEAFSKVEVDGVAESEISTGHTFWDIGIHTIKYTLATETKIPDNAFSGAAIYDFEIPDSVEEIGANAFSNTASYSIYIPDSVVSLGNGAFSGCGRALNITISKNLEIISANAFKSCNGVSALTIPDSVLEIGDKAFFECSGLTHVTIGSSVTQIGSKAFAHEDYHPNLSNLRYIFGRGSVAPAIQNDTFKNVRPQGTVNIMREYTGYDVWVSTEDYYLGKYNWHINYINAF